MRAKPATGSRELLGTNVGEQIANRDNGKPMPGFARGNRPWPTNLSARYFQVSLGMGARFRQLDLHIIAQAGDEPEQPVGGKAIEAASEQVGHLGLADAKKLRGFGLGETPPLDDPQNLAQGGREMLARLRRREAKVEVAVRLELPPLAVGASEF